MFSTLSPAGATILVVDDDLDIRDALATLLRDEGYAVLTAGDGQIALDMLSIGVRPAVILLDLMMPVVNGFDFLERLRKSVDFAAIPVIVLSANRGYQAVDLRVSAVLRKPALLEELIEAIEGASA